MMTQKIELFYVIDRTTHHRRDGVVEVVLEPLNPGVRASNLTLELHPDQARALFGESRGAVVTVVPG